MCCLKGSTGKSKQQEFCNCSGVGLVVLFCRLSSDCCKGCADASTTSSSSEALSISPSLPFKHDRLPFSKSSRDVILTKKQTH